MKGYDKVIDYIIEQANTYDIKNMQFEEDIIFLVNRERDALIGRVVSVATDITTILRVQLIMTRIEAYFMSYNSNIKMILANRFKEYHTTAYKQMSDLISLGKEVDGKLSSKVTEITQNREYDEKSIEFIRDHAFELLKGHSATKVEQIRGALGDLMLSGKGTKANIREKIIKILNVNKSKAEEIAQTELSRAYNYGTMSRLNEYQNENPLERVRKYWHGFKYSEVTCTYCRPRIGEIYDLNDITEALPAHVRCRCIWLPLLDGWDKPVSAEITRRANMLNMVYTPEQVYGRIDSRLGISYGKYIDQGIATDYINGDRSQRTMTAIADARNNAINDTKQTFTAAIDKSNSQLSQEFNTQMGFWKGILSKAMVDNDRDLLERSREAIKGVMILPWNSKQLTEWNNLLSEVSNNIR